MIKNIKLLVEDYFNSTEQMSNMIKNYDKETNKLNRDYDKRYSFIVNILGKITYNKYANKGTFAPLPLSALNLTFKDFYYLNGDINIRSKILDPKYEQKTNKLISSIAEQYKGKEFKLIDNGNTMVIHTNIVFRTMDEIINFLLYIQKQFKYIFKSDNIIWKSISQKFKKYLN